MKPPFSYDKIPPPNTLMAEENIVEEKEKKGYSIIEDQAVVCGNCKEKLLNVITIMEADIEHELQVRCPFCGDESFLYTATGKLAIGSYETTVIMDMKCEQVEPNKFQHYIEVDKA